MTAPNAELDESRVDPAKVEQFLSQLVSVYTGSMLNYMIDIGHRTGLFAAAAQGPATSAELADRAGLTERYVREWLGAMVTGAVFDFAPADQRYSLPPEHAVCLTEGPTNLAPMALLQTHLGKHVDQVARVFREGGGVPYAAYRPEFTDVMDMIGRGTYDALLIDAYLPLVRGLTERMRAGGRVADVACGTGHALVLLAERFRIRRSSASTSMKARSPGPGPRPAERGWTMFASRWPTRPDCR